MSGLLRRIRRPGAAEDNRTEPTALPAPAHGSAPASPAPSEDGQRLPAGTATEDVARREATGRRGKLRRRARFLRKARELALRDLGGLVYEARRREQDPGKLAQEKVDKLIALDAELNELDAALGAPRGATVLREPGVGGTCARCGELHPSGATFCAKCGANLAEAAREAAAAEAERRAAAEKAAADKAAEADTAEAERAEAENAEAEKAGAEKPALTEKPAAAKKPAAEKPAATEKPAAAKKPAAEKPAAAKKPAAEKAQPESEQPTAEHGADGGGNGRFDSEAPTEVAEPAATRDRPA